MAWNFEVKNDKAGKPRWWLYSDGTLKAASGESFYDTGDAKRAAREFKASAATDDYHVWETDEQWYWDATSPQNGKKVATGAKGYPSKGGAEGVANAVRYSAAGASGP
jgi:uncharacterized protein YegP (UPF0339 family)